ncbi:Jacalin-like lectin domain protein [Ceratobasidium sp. AG-Ba]|nr:Jacalin-like lectin domain protein [Ceratobasidium sp. AG-Ba]QRW07655.1 Jacalin-like lectin domain protein [Ceratobasidium sp. AG-Ba]
MASLVLSLLALGGCVTAQAGSGSFNVLSYNVDISPELLSSGDPAINTPLLAPRLAPYGIVNVQEDFNYHAALYAGDTAHAYRTPTSGGVPFGSGLNTLSKYPYIDLQRVKWDKCAIGSGDCLTPKGFTLLRARLDTGVYIDIYNLHTDAGSESADISARSANIAQVASYINSNSIGNAVLIYGDTNSRYTRTGDGIRQFLNAGFTDVWLKMVRGSSIPVEGSNAITCPSNGQGVTNSCETVDKIFYRSSPALSLTATKFNNENSAFLNSTGFPLSDHYPLTASFTYTLATNRRLTDLTGGAGGTWFNDLSSIPSSPSVSSITIAGANRLDSISLAYSSGQTIKHGGSGGTSVSITLSSGERVTSVRVDTGSYNSGTRLFYIELKTSAGRTLGVGAKTSSSVTWTAPNGMGLVGFYGRSGDGVDLLGAIWG